MTDQDLLTDLQLAVLEPPDGGQSWPSEAWTRDEVLGNLNASIWSLLRDTHLVITRAEIVVLANATSVALPTDWIATAEAVWRSAANVRTPLGPVDAFEGDCALPSWETTPGTPIGLVDLDLSTLTARLIPTPITNGTVELLYVARPATVAGAGTTLGVPDDYLSGVKYQTLGQMLRKVGRLTDPERAAYCEGRYRLTVTVAEIILGGWS